MLQTWHQFFVQLPECGIKKLICAGISMCGTWNLVTSWQQFPLKVAKQPYQAHLSSWLVVNVSETFTHKFHRARCNPPCSNGLVWAPQHYSSPLEKKVFSLKLPFMITTASVVSSLRSVRRILRCVPVHVSISNFFSSWRVNRETISSPGDMHRRMMAHVPSDSSTF